MTTWLFLALRQLRNHPRFSFFFCLNLALGLSGFVTLDAFKETLQDELRKGSKSILSGDLRVSLRNRRFSRREQEKIFEALPKGSLTTHSWSLFTMAATEDKSKLIRLVGVTESYPLYGEITFESGKVIDKDATKDVLEDDSAWIYPELGVQLQLEAGSVLKIGKREFKVSDVVLSDSASTGSAFDFAPKVYVDDALIPDLQLMSPGSRFREAYYVRLPEDTDLSALTASLKESFSEYRDVRVETHLDASENLARSLTYLTDYLGLMALVALFLSALGSTYLFRSFIYSKRREIATLMSVGATGSESRNLYVLQLLILGGLSALLALAIAVAVFPIVPVLAQDLLPVVLHPKINFRVAAVALIMGTLGSVLICLPLLASIRKLKPAVLFHDYSASANSGWRYLHWNLPVIALYWLMAIWEAQSVYVGSIFIVSFVGAAFLFGLISWLLWNLLNKLPTKRITLKMAIRQLYRNQLSSASCFLAISLGALLICMVPQIQTLVLEEVSSPAGVKLPSLFLVDIQEDQLQDVQDFLTTQGSGLTNTSPLVRARLSSINNEEVLVRDEDEKPLTRERDRERWVRSRGQNITVRARPSTSETIVQGEEFGGRYDSGSDQLPQISLEYRFADRLNVTVGDTLKFDIEGVEVEAQVQNIRRVRWTSFQPNFFIVMQPGVLDDAPKTYIASIPGLETPQKLEIQNLLVERFPNISIVDVANTIARILAILAKMGWIVQVMAAFALIAGFVVLFSIANHQARIRRWDINLFKVLGADFSLVRATMFWEFGMLGLAAAVTGACGSFVVSYLFAKLVFDAPWVISWQVPLVAMILIVFVSVLTALRATHSVLKEKPLGILKEGA